MYSSVKVSRPSASTFGVKRKHQQGIGRKSFSTQDYQKAYQPPKNVSWVYGFESGTKSKAPHNFRDLLDSLSARQVLDIKQQEVTEINENASVFDAVKLMNDKHIGSTLVVTKNTQGGKELSGIFTERDYIRKIILQGLSSSNVKLKDIMTKEVVTIASSKSILDCAKIMTAHHFRHLPIVKTVDSETAQYASGSVLGVISSRDLIRFIIEASEQATEKCKLYLSVNEIFGRLCRKASIECYIEDNDSVFKAIEIMDKNRLGALIVNRSTDIVGIFTERDYLTKIIMKGRSSKSTLVKDVMSPNVVSVSPTEPAINCLKVMNDNGFRNLPILTLVGDGIDYEEKLGVPLGLITDMNVVEYVYKMAIGLYD